MRAIYVLLVAVAFASACGQEARSKTSNNVVVPDTDTGTSADVSDELVVDGEVTISTSTTREVTEIGMFTAGSGEALVVVAVEIANGLDAAIPAAFTLFRLRVDALEILASPASVDLPDVCPSNSLLSAGQTLACTVAFAIPESATPSALIFQTPSGDVEAEITFEPCTRCDGRCVDLLTSREHCGECGVEVPGFGVCMAGTPQCADGGFLCDGYCISEETNCVQYSR